MKSISLLPFYAGLFMVATLSCSRPVVAGTIQIVNENKKPLKLKISPEGSDTSEEYLIDLAGDHYTSVEVTAEQLGGKNYYRINGSTSLFGGTCKNLSIRKNYRITFQNDAIGTTCLAEEMVA
jgi:hypothetical protein